MSTLLIGLDDTDNDTSPGTGRLARDLMALAVERGLTPVGVTRHQFLVDPRIPYTSHNSGACVALRGAGGAADGAFAFDFVAERAAPGSDPGVCVAEIEAVADAVTALGRRATREIVTKADAYAAARAGGLDLRELGGSGLGVIGALGSVGLHAGGADGRFIDMPGLRALGDRVALDELAAIGITVRFEGDRAGEPPAGPCCTLGWIRPRLMDGRALLPLEWSASHHAWIPVDRQQAKQGHSR